MNLHRVLICAVAILAGSPVLAQDYEIRLTRPAKVGQKYEVIMSAEKSEQMTISVEGRVVQETKSFLSATLEGTITFLKVDKLQRESEIRLLVSKCRKKTGKNAVEEEVLPKGTQVVARRRDSKKEFLVNGKVAGKDIAKVLDLFFSLKESQVTDDDILGTKERKKLGDSWAINSRMAAQDFTSEGLKVDVENIKGSAKIEKVVVVRSTKCLQISGKTELGMITPPLPVGFKIEKSNLSLTFSGEFPVDTSIGRLSEKITGTMALLAKLKPSSDAPEITLSMKMTQSKQMQRKLLK